MSKPSLSLPFFEGKISTSKNPCFIHVSSVAKISLKQFLLLASILGPLSLSATPTQADVDVLLRQNDYPKAQTMLEEILHQAEAVSPQSVVMSDALFNLAWFHSNLSHFDLAEKLFRRCLALRVQQLGPRHPHVALVLNGLAVVHDNNGRSLEAEAFYLQAVTIQQEQLGSESLEVASTLHNLGTLYWDRSDYRKASRYLHQALDIRELKLGPGAIKTSTTLNNLALLERSLGNTSEAEKLFRRVLAVREKKLGSQHPLTLTTANHLGLVLADEKRYPEAVILLKRSAEGKSRVIGEEQADTARAWFQLAWVYDLMGKYAEAEPLHYRALHLREKILGPQHPDTAGSDAYLARHFHLQGRVAEALPLYQKALSVMNAQSSPSSSDQLSVQENLGYAYLDLGQREDAVRCARETMRLREELLRNLFDFALEDQRLAFLRTLRPYTVAAALENATEVARASLRTRGIILDSLLEEARLARRSDSPENKALYERWQKIRTLPLTGSDESTRREARRLQEELSARVLAEPASHQSLTLDPGSVCEALPSDVACVEYIRYDEYQSHLQFRAAYGALVYQRRTGVQWIPLGEAEKIDPLIGQFQRAMRHRVRGEALRENLDKLRSALWHPLEKQVAPDTRRLWISPEGPLAQLAWEVLPDPTVKWLGTRYQISYLASARDALEQPLWDSRGDSLTVVDDPAFGGNKTAWLASLSGTRQEAEAITAQAKAAGVFVLGVEGSAATEEAITKLQPNGIVHFATHGLYLNPERYPFARAWRPGQRALLALAGANRALQKAESAPLETSPQDGLWMAEEIAALDWPHTTLAVLSGCDTGLGISSAGEGVLGLNRALRMAGVPRVIHSLWPVADEPTAEWMKAFYAELFRGATPAEALQRIRVNRLNEIEKSEGLCQAVRQAGAFVLTQ
jgi:CHAT domain-containing protein/Flp pilus assembly protein TadD